MKLTKVNNDNLTILNLGDIQIAFSYKTPIAINHKAFTFFNDKFYSKTTSEHCNIIADVWGINRNDCGLGNKTFNCLLNAIKTDINRIPKNRMDYIKQLQEIPLD